MNRIGLIASFVFLSLLVISWIAAGSGEVSYNSDSRDSVMIRSCLSHNELQRLDSTNFIYDPAEILVQVRKELKRSIRDSRFSLLHIGDSHIASGFWSDRFRELMQKCFGSAGRGLVLPFGNSSLSTNRDYSIISPQKWTSVKLTQPRSSSVDFGVGGYLFRTASSTVTFDVSSEEPFDRVRVFCHSEAPRFEVADSVAAEICCPDTTAECMTIVLKKSVNKVQLKGRTVEGFRRPIYYGMSLESGNSGVLYHAVGVIGAAMEHYNHNPEILAAAKNLEPNLVIVSLGTNESFGKNFTWDYFHHHITEMVESIRSAAPQAAIIFTTPMENCRRSRGRYVVNKNARLASEVLKNYAGEFGYAVWDWYEISGGAGTSKSWVSRGLMQSDRIHLTSEGYRLQAELLFSALIRDVE